MKNINVTSRVTSKGELFVPPRLWRNAGLRPGDHVDFKASRGVITIFPKRPREEDSDVTLWSAEAKIIRRGEAQLKGGESKRWRSEQKTRSSKFRC
jgi:bifunctional DNA-binding transcriptional regulator/antitoxin component of YhaV-PrlF toxin-antitoxin module